MKKKPDKIITLALILLLTLSFSGVRYTNAYFNDTETSSDNSFSTSSLDFSLDSDADFTPLVTPTADATRNVDVTNDGSLGFDYSVKIANPVGALCPALNLSASLGGGAGVTEPLNTFDIGSFTFGDLEDWDFTVSLNDDDIDYQEETCVFDIVFDGEQIGGAGFSDTETIANTVTAGMWGGVTDMVLNEIYPAPPSSGNPTPPNDREWVELYNGSASSIDVLDWKISELSGGSRAEQMYTISTACSAPSASKVIPYSGASTVIASGGLLVVEFCTGSNVLNNPRDTVRLYDSASILFDAHTYPATANGKSHQRIPDGGIWVDPEPTPGEPNRVSMQGLIDAGFDEATIQIIIALLAEKGETLLDEEAVIIEEVVEEVITEDIIIPNPVEEDAVEVIEDAPPTIAPEVVTEILEVVETVVESITPPSPELAPEVASAEPQAE